MRKVMLLAILPLAGCQFSGALDSGGLVNSIDNKLTLPLQACSGLLLQTKAIINQTNAGLAAQAQMPSVVTVPTPVVVMPSPNLASPPTVAPMVVPPPPIKAPKPVPTVP